MKICFEDGFNGLVNIGDQNIRIGVNGAKPYDFTFTAADRMPRFPESGILKEFGSI